MFFIRCTLCCSLFNVGEVTSVLNSGGPNSFIRGLANDSAQTFGPTVTEDLRDFLFSPNFSRKYIFFITLFQRFFMFLFSVSDLITKCVHTSLFSNKMKTFLLHQ